MKRIKKIKTTKLLDILFIFYFLKTKSINFYIKCKISNTKSTNLCYALKNYFKKF